MWKWAIFNENWWNWSALLIRKCVIFDEKLRNWDALLIWKWKACACARTRASREPQWRVSLCLTDPKTKEHWKKRKKIERRQKNERCCSLLENRRFASFGWFSVVSARFSSNCQESRIQKNILAQLGFNTTEKEQSKNRLSCLLIPTIRTINRTRMNFRTSRPE